MATTTTTLDLQLVDTHKLTQLALADVSRYVGTITNPSMEITVPGYSKINVPFTPTLVNIYDAVLLELGTDVEGAYLPDGIYDVKYSISPNTTMYVEKSFMRIGYIDSIYKRSFLQIDNGCDCDHKRRTKLKDELRSIRLLIDGSVAAADNCDTGTANKLYQQAFRMIQNLKLCECA